MMTRITEQSTLYLVGIRIEPDIVEPQLYTIYVDDDRPILCGGRPILFAQPDLAAAALRESDCGASAFGVAPSELYTVYDLADALFTLNDQNEAENPSLLDCVNLLLDFCNAIDEPMPTAYRSSLESLADHLTFHKPFGDFLKENGLCRRTITDAFYWCIGMIVYQMKLLT